MKHLHTLSILIGHAKTRKTLCGQRRPEKELAVGQEVADCTVCRMLRDKEIATCVAVLQAADAIGKATPEMRASIEAFADPVNRYRNAELLR